MASTVMPAAAPAMLQHPYKTATKLCSTQLRIHERGWQFCRSLATRPSTAEQTLSQVVLYVLSSAIQLAPRAETPSLHLKRARGSRRRAVHATPIAAKQGPAT